MEEMDDLYIKLQVFLMKKDKECGELRFLTSRTTVEISGHVQDVCSSVAEIFRSCEIPIEEETSITDPRCIQAFKYLILNTYFECQKNLTEDLANGHLVDMCPPLSLYLLTEILWSLRYEEIVAESILHVPLDLATEIIEISRRCINLLNFERGFNFLTKITANCYRKLHMVDRIGTQTWKLDESLESLMINCQELMALFGDEKFTRFDEVAEIKKSERHGIILKRLLGLTTESLECSNNGYELSHKNETLYKITFGREPLQRPNENFANQLRILTQEFVHLLLKKLKEIDCKTYIAWASLEDTENRAMSLQTSIGNDCYRFLEFTREYKNLVQFDHLVECLQQFSSKPKIEESSATMNLEELRNGAIEGKKESIKELLNRHREWNHEILDIVRKNINILDKDDFLNLLEYLTVLMTKPGQEEHKRQVYTTVTKVLLLQNIPDVYETILSYIMKHDARNTLESPHTEQSFVKFMSHNTNFKSPRNLRLLLFFLLKNPRKFLSILLKISLGDPEYENILVTPSDLVLLSPIMNIYEKTDETLLLVALGAVFLETREINAKKFAHLVQVLLENCLLNADTIVNKIFIPCLNEKKMSLGNLRCIGNCLRKIANLCTRETHLESLIISMARKMSNLRRDYELPKYSINETLSLMTRVVEIFLHNVETWLDEGEKNKLVERMEILEPVEKRNFSRFSMFDCWRSIDVSETIKEYERKCFIVMNRVCSNREIIPNEEERNNVNFDFSRYEQDFLRHLVVKSTEIEYVRLATEATIFQWDNLGCKDEYEACEKIVGITIQAGVYFLEFPALNSPDSFACLMKGFAGFTRAISSLREVRDTKKIYETIINGMRALDGSIKKTVFSHLYSGIILMINNRACHEPVEESLREIVRLIDNFGNKCLEISHDDVNFEREARSNEAKRYKIAHDFIEECMSVNDDGSYASLLRIYNLFCYKHDTTDVS